MDSHSSHGSSYGSSKNRASPSAQSRDRSGGPNSAAGSDDDGYPDWDDPTAGPASQPSIMTVGNGPAPAHAAELAALIGSGIGSGPGSVNPSRPGSTGKRRIKGKENATADEDDKLDSLWQISSHTNSVDAGFMSGPASGPGSLADAAIGRHGIDPGAYCRNQKQLADAITAVSELLGQLRQMNRDWPARWNPGDDSARTDQLRILKLDLHIAGGGPGAVVGKLQTDSVSAVLDGQIGRTVRHMELLRDRILDRTSKVLVTGDLNAGKSTFCNALLRRSVMPVDQQPCTTIFCEVLPAENNGGVEEVHAVPTGCRYDRMDARTYSVFPLADIESIVIDCNRWSMCKVYLAEGKSATGLLRDGRGAADIALIDAPGLNADSLQTTAVFARQEEIDVVVFVVSAANHFTQSAKEFIASAAREKAYVFVVVNGFDQIRDKDRCRGMILGQVKKLSPATHAESDELVHFVSSRDGAPPPDGGDGDDGPGPSRDSAFDDLEASLRRFVLDKKSRSKLAPARTYLLNVLADMAALTSSNRQVAADELAQAKADIGRLEPELRASKSAAGRAADEADTLVETEATAAYEASREALRQTADELVEGAADLVPYPGIWHVSQFVDHVRFALIDELAGAVEACEEAARARTVAGVTCLAGLGLARLGSGFGELKFRSANMFSRRRAGIPRVELDVELADLFDLGDVRTLVDQHEKRLAGASVALTLAGAAGSHAFGGWAGAIAAARFVGLPNLRSLVVPGLIVAGVAGVVAVGCFVSAIPTALPRRLARKLRSELITTDHPHMHATRIAAEVRRALKYPADHLRAGLRRQVDSLENACGDVVSAREKADSAVRAYSALESRTTAEQASVERIDLDGRRWR